MLNIAEIYNWTAWQPLEKSWLLAALPNLPGLYRIRRAEAAPIIDYIGQTGNSLKQRMSHLRGIYGQKMPYRAPHTAGPGLWSLIDSLDCNFEVSVLPIQGGNSWRLGLEALAISLYRQINHASPTVNFGRMPAGYKISSSNDIKLKLSGKRFRGGQTLENSANHSPTIAPVGLLESNPLNPNWGGHVWSEWLPVTEAVEEISKKQKGLYRLRSGKDTDLEIIYIGQGLVRARLESHYRRIILNNSFSMGLLSNIANLEASFVLNPNWLDNQLLELENDLIASHLLFFERVPILQFRGMK